MKTQTLFKTYSTVLTAFVVGIALTLSSCGDDDDGPILSSEAEVLSFSFNELDPVVTGNISGQTITATVPYNVDVTSLAPTVTISDKASVTPASGIARDFSSPVQYTVTAENGTEVIYTVDVTQEDPPMLVVTTKWERNLNSGGLPSWFTANNDRDIAVHGDFVYIHNNTDKIRVVSSADGTDVDAGNGAGFIDAKENYASGNLFLLNAATDDNGVILGSNLRVGSDSQHPWYVYKWADKDATQELLINYPTPAGYRLGENLAVVGDVTQNATIYVPGSGFGTANNQVLKFTVTGGVANNTPEFITLSGIDNMGNAPDAYPVSGEANSNIIVAGTGIGGIAEYDASGNLVGKLPEALNTGETALLFTFALDVRPFELDGRKVIATTATDFTENAADSGYLYLIDYTDGWENITAENIVRKSFTPAGNIDTNFNGTGGVDVVVNGSTATVYAMITNFGIGAYNVSFE